MARPWGGTYVTRYCGHFWPIVQPQMIDEGDCGAIVGMKIDRGNRSTQRKSAPAPFCPPQIPLDQTRARTRSAAVGSQRLTARAMARPKILPYTLLCRISERRSELSCALFYPQNASGLVTKVVSLQ
jgi:hypothetical protein